jgi:hypothetical protein
MEVHQALRCKFCGMDSPDLVWKNTESNVNLPAKWKLFFHNNLHKCKPKPEPLSDMVFCPKCDPLVRKKIPRSELKKHLEGHL